MYHIAKPFINPVSQGYNVEQINEIYGYNKLTYKPVENGPELNICIVIAYSYPNLQSDLDQFCSLNNIPSTNLNIITLTANTPSSSIWTTEICLDTQWLHAICPYAKITVIETASASLDDLSKGIQYANNLNPKPYIINMSWGFDEFKSSTNINIFDPNIIYIAASGDTNTLQWPSTSPDTLCVSATTITTNSSGNKLLGESAWVDSGCGPSAYFPIPNYQKNNVKNISSEFRLCSDISIDGNPSSGCYIYSEGNYFIIGGTSLSSPIISGTMGIILYQRLINNKPLYNTNQNSPFGIQNILYNLYGSQKNIYSYIFNDITKGNSGSYNATLGYDYPTGLGSPNITTFVPYLINDYISPFYQVHVTANSAVAFSNPDSSSGSASSVISVTATSTDIAEKMEIEKKLIDHLEKHLIPSHLNNLVPKENTIICDLKHNYQIDCKRII